MLQDEILFKSQKFDNKMLEINDGNALVCKKLMCCSSLICKTFLIQEGVMVSEKMHWLKNTWCV